MQHYMIIHTVHKHGWAAVRGGKTHTQLHSKVIDERYILISMVLSTPFNPNGFNVHSCQLIIRNSKLGRET